jgi:hypothetical protein
MHQGMHLAVQQRYSSAKSSRTRTHSLTHSHTHTHTLTHTLLEQNPDGLTVDQETHSLLSLAANSRKTRPDVVARGDRGRRGLLGCFRNL